LFQNGKLRLGLGGYATDVHVSQCTTVLHYDRQNE